MAALVCRRPATTSTPIWGNYSHSRGPTRASLTLRNRGLSTMRAIFSYGIALIIVLGLALWLATGVLVTGGKGPGNGERPILGAVATEQVTPEQQALLDEAAAKQKAAEDAKKAADAAAEEAKKAAEVADAADSESATKQEDLKKEAEAKAQAALKAKQALD